jgi:NAD(P)-dependent dehydrogenase (short-subunit alcohol dehydrogenase family)
VSERPVAVVTGAGRGIGAAVAIGLATAGWDLVLGDVADPDAVAGLTYALSSSADLDRVARDCRSQGAGVTTAPCDVRSEPDVLRLVTQASGRLVAAVAVAGILGSDGLAWEQTTADLDRDLSVNLHGVASTRGLPRLAGYVAAKHAALGFLQSLAADLAPHGVTANAVLPGSTRTDLLKRTAEAYGLASSEQFVANQRIGRLIEPAEVAASVVWLCSAAASAITGSAVSVDGGFTG